MTILRNRKKLAAVNRVNHEDRPKNNQARNTNSHGLQENYITQVSEEVESRVTKNLAPEFIRTESRILGALSWLDELLQNPQSWVHSGNVPETSRNLKSDNQGTNEGHSQNDPNPEVEVSLSQSSQYLNPEETSEKSRNQTRPQLTEVATNRDRNQPRPQPTETATGSWQSLSRSQSLLGS